MYPDCMLVPFEKVSLVRCITWEAKVSSQHHFCLPVTLLALGLASTDVPPFVLEMQMKRPHFLSECMLFHVGKHQPCFNKGINSYALPTNRSHHPDFTPLIRGNISAIAHRTCQISHHWAGEIAQLEIQLNIKSLNLPNFTPPKLERYLNNNTLDLLDFSSLSCGASLAVACWTCLWEVSSSIPESTHG